MPMYLQLLEEPCDVIENWKSSIILNDENTNIAKSCWVRIGDRVVFKYWLKDNVYQAEIKATKLPKQKVDSK